MFRKPLFIFDIANNHQGSVAHGKNIIAALHGVAAPFMGEFNIAVKFQYRNLKTFIHKDSYDSNDIKHVKRFRETMLTPEQYAELKNDALSKGFFAVCTPFDEDSIPLIIAHNYNAIKIASCSFTDWPLLECIAAQGKPVIASCAGAPLADIQKVANFFRNRRLDFSLMHCVAEYPAPIESLQLNQIDLLKSEFPGLRVGFSTHESPDVTDSVKIAVSKGAEIFEKHIGLSTDTISVNAYSAQPPQIEKWLRAASDAYKMCGIKGARYTPSVKETEDLLSLRRGVFAKHELKPGGKLKKIDSYLAFPCVPGQLLTSHLSKYSSITITNSVISPDEPVMLSNISIKNNAPAIQKIITEALELIHKSGAVIPTDSTCEISHHYGLDKFDKTGVTIINCINREYCKKILVMLPGQRCPEHKHELKEETFTVLFGELAVLKHGDEQTVHKGESMIIERGAAHEFRSDTGCVFEEISTTHSAVDSYYGEEEANFVNPRKTEVYITKELLEGM